MKKITGVLLLCFCMLVCMTPVNVFADEEYSSKGKVIVLDEELFLYDEIIDKDSNVFGLSYDGLITLLNELSINYEINEVYDGSFDFININSQKTDNNSSNLTKLKNENEKLKKEIEKLKKEIETNSAKSKKTTKSDNAYTITDFSKICNSGYTTSYRGKWDKVTSFKVADEIIKGDSVIAFKFKQLNDVYNYKGKNTPSYPTIRLINPEHDYKKLKLSYAVDDIAKNYAGKARISIRGYSELLGTRHLISKAIERNEEIQTIEVDIEKYTNITIIIYPYITNRGYDNTFYRDYIVLKDVQLIK